MPYGLQAPLILSQQCTSLSSLISQPAQTLFQACVDDRNILWLATKEAVIYWHRSITN